jgi:hypothetical protein
MLYLNQLSSIFLKKFLTKFGAGYFKMFGNTKLAQNEVGTEWRTAKPF